MGTVLTDIAEERQRQHEKWGEQNHLEPFWATILGEEFGEACQAALRYYEHGVRANGVISDEVADMLRSELIQVAAVAVAWIECLDRNRE